MSSSNDLSSKTNLIEIVKNIDRQLRLALPNGQPLERNKDSNINMCLMLIASVIKADEEGAPEVDFASLLIDLIKHLDDLIERSSNNNRFSLKLDKVKYFLRHLKRALNVENYTADLSFLENSSAGYHPEFHFLRQEIEALKDVTKFFDNGSKSKVENFLNSMQEKFDQISDLEQEAQKKFIEITESLEQNSQKIAETVGRLSTDAVSGRFNSRALEEKKSAERMQWAAILLMCLAISLVFLSALKIVDFWGWQDLLVRSLATITLFITAGYFANEANKHRRLQHKYERIHLDLSAIDPFIATFDDETQRTLKSEVARRVFVTSHGEDLVKHASKDDIPTNLAEVMGEMLKVLKTLNKKED